MTSSINQAQIAASSQLVSSLPPYQSDNPLLVEWVRHKNKAAGRQFIHTMKTATLETRHQMLMELAKVCVENHDADPIQECLKALSLEQLGVTVGQSLDILNKEITYRAKADQIENLTEEVTGIQTPQQAHGVCRVVKLFFETILRSLTFFQPGWEPLTTWEAAQALSLYKEFLVAPFLLLGLMGMIFSPLTALIVSGAILLGLVASITIYAKYFRTHAVTPFPSRNLTAPEVAKQVHMVGRQQILQRINRELGEFTSTPNGQRKHVLLVGQPGVGKTTLVEALGKSIWLGDVPDHLKGNDVLRMHTGQLGDSLNAPDNVQPFERAMGHINRQKTVIVLDELHLALLSQKQLLDRILEVGDHIPKLIGITNPAGLAALSANPAFVRRFNPIFIDPTTPEETRQILREILSRIAPELEIDDATLQTLVSNSTSKKKDGQPVGVQPDQAKQLLYQLIDEMRAKQSETHLSNNLKDCESKYEKALQELATNQDSQSWVQKTQAAQRREVRLNLVRKKHDAVLQIRKQFYALKQQERQQRGWAAHLAIQCTQQPENKLSKRRYLFTTRIFGEALKQRIESVRFHAENQHINLVTRITAEDVEKVINKNAIAQPV